MPGLTVLLTNHTLGDRGGSDLFVRDVAMSLLARGHRPVVYSPLLGTVAEDLRVATIPVTSDLDSLAERPDIIHGQHHLETMTALLHFPGVPGIFYSHGWLPPEEAPPRFPRILQYIAVDDVCRDRLVCEHGLPAGDVQVLLNFVDTARFLPRPPLPPRPAAALLFCNEDGPHVAVVREACARVGLSLDLLGRSFGTASPAPESLLGRYEVIFAKGRSALEALAVGAAVVPIGAFGLGPMVTAADFDRLRRLNFGIRTMRLPLTATALIAEVARYDAADAAEVSRRVRASAGREEAVDTLLALYRGVLDRWRDPLSHPDANEESRAASRYLRSITSAMKWATLDRAALTERAAAADVLPAQLHERIAGLETHIDHARATIGNMERSRFWRARKLWVTMRDWRPSI
jgi:hypothetical protein